MDLEDIINAEIKWCEQHEAPPDTDKQSFIRGLKQAKLLIVWK